MKPTRQTLSAIVVLAVLFALAIGGCAKKPEEAIIGKWGVDVDALAEMDEFKSMPEEEKKAALEMAKGMMATATIEFAKDKVIMEMMGKKEEAPYTVKSSEANKVVLETEKDGKKEDVTVEINGDKLIMHMGEKEKMPLVRKS
jgi:hypothetical protein